MQNQPGHPPESLDFEHSQKKALWFFSGKKLGHTAGSAVTGTHMCFSCTTLEADDSEDYEIY